ncbi:MAG TPA: T9SS type A sorting domain-containing protein [bacterium]|nr:T9SS type A sorting domain-containing protein [bacterium]
MRDRLVAFGGIDTLNAYADVHVLPLSGGGVWTPLATTGTPPPAAMTQFYWAEFDAVGDRMLVIGAGGGPNLLVYSLTFGGTPTWSQVAVDGTPPRERSGFASAFNAAEKQWLVSGGDFDTHVDDVWVLFLDPEASVNATPLGYAVLPDHIHVAWQEVGMPLESFTAYRRDNGGPWQAIAALVPDGDRRLTVDDPVSTPVSSYDYRVSAIVGGTERFFGELNIPFGTSVPPAAGRVSFEARPNPTRGAIDLAVDVVSTSTLRIELLDLSGRRVVERTAALGPGEHMFRLAEPHALRPGLYFARLSEGRQRTVVKVVVIE